MNKFENTVKEMQDNIADLENFAREKVEQFADQDLKERANDIANKTIAAINSSIEKVGNVINSLSEDEKMDELLDKIQAKSQEAVDFAKDKINSLNKDNSKLIDDLAEDVMAEFDRLKENDTFRNATEFLKEIDGKINTFFERPEVKAAVNKAKVTTVNVASAGLEGLKRVLKTDEINSDNKEEE